MYTTEVISHTVHDGSAAIREGQIFSAKLTCDSSMRMNPGGE